MKKIINKNNIYKFIIFITLLSVVCVYTAHQINNLLFSLAENPYYTNIYNIDDKTLSIRMNDSWKRNQVESVLSFSNHETSEELILSIVEEGKYNIDNFETIKTFFKLEFNDSYNNNIDLDIKETSYKNKNDIYAISFNLNGKYNIVGIGKVDNEYINFSYTISSSSKKTSELTNMLDSIRINSKKIQGDEIEIENK
jgi:hypothetical protein